MRHSVFRKFIIGLLIIITLAEIALLSVMYKFTYDNTVKDATEHVRYAAKTAADLFEFYDPNNINNYKDGSQYLNDYCDSLDITYLYVIKPDLKNKDELYLARGYGANAAKEFKVNRYSGYVAKGKLKDEQIRAYKGVKEVMLHESNQYDDTIICYTPVEKYLSSKTHKFVEKTESIVCAEVSITSIMQAFNQQFNTIIFITIFVTILILVSTGLILYFRVSKPLRLISERMKGFVSQKGDFFEKLPVKGKDEIAEMSDAFNTMAEDIDRFITELSELNRQKAELNIAKNIQMGFLEPQSFQSDTVSIRASMLPARDVGGDLYYYHILDNGNIVVIIADVSGKGITGAFFMSSAITLLSNYAESGASPSKILFDYNNHLAAHNPNLMFITTFVAIYNPKTGELTYSNAGHNNPYVLSDRLITLDGEHGVAAGIFNNAEYEEFTIKLNEGDLLFMYTDGVSEAQNKEGGFFGEDRIEACLKNHYNCDAESLLDDMLEEIKTFAGGAEQADDITMLALKLNPENTQSLRVESKKENLKKVNEIIEKLDISEDLRFQLNLMAEEVFVNICSYAYEDKTGEIDFTVKSGGGKVIMTFSDSGIPFNSSENVIDIDEYDRDTAVGGLGRFLTFSIADEYSYERADGKNVLTIIKNIPEDS